MYEYLSLTIGDHHETYRSMKAIDRTKQKTKIEKAAG